MSFAAQNWAWDQVCPSGISKTVLLYLANCADGSGCCYPSVATICRVTQHAKRPVLRALRELLEAKLIEREHKKVRGGFLSNRYRLPVISEVGDERPQHLVTISPNTLVTIGPDTGGQTTPTLGDDRVHKPIIEPVEERKKEVTPYKSPKGDARSKEPDGFAEFYAAYPRKTQGRKPVLLAYARAIREGASVDDILDGLGRCQFSLNPQYRPLATTWLNQQRWQAERVETAEESVLRQLSLDRPEPQFPQLKLIGD